MLINRCSGVNKANFWNTSGCMTVEYENGSVMCSCNHLTHFAILLSPGAEVSCDYKLASCFDNTISNYMYMCSEIDSFGTSGNIDNDRTIVCVILTSVPVGYYSDICTTKVSYSLLKWLSCTN